MTAAPDDPSGGVSLMLLPETVADPYPFYRELLHAPTPRHDPALNAWLVARHSDVLQALRDPRLSVSRNAGFLELLPHSSPDEFAPLREFFGSWLSFSDPPEHTRRRAPWAGELTPRVAARLRPVVEEVADHLVSRAALLRGCEVLTDFRPLPGLVLARFLGLEHAELMAFRPWVEDVGRFMTTPTVAAARQAQATLQRWREWFDDLLRRGSGAGGDGVLLRLAADPDGLGADQLFALLASLVTGPASRERGSNEPTVQFLAKALNVLLDHPTTLRRLRAAPELIPRAVDELLRFEPPFHFVTRSAAAALEIGGAQIRAGERVLLLLAAANRDLAQFPAPDELRLDREGNRHVAFGFGAHFCLGAPLARMEIEATLGAILRRTTHLRRAEPVRWRMEGGFRALEELQLDLGDNSGLHVLLDEVEALTPQSLALALKHEGEAHD